MTKKRKDGKIFNCYLSAEIYEQLHDYCVKNDYTMQPAIREENGKYVCSRRWEWE